MPLNGVDVSGNNPADILTKISFDFAFVKASGNPKRYSWNYKNPYMKQQADDALKRSGLLGLYHFTWGKPAEQEADFFCEVVKDYIGKAILVIDYEADALSRGREWVRTFIRRVKKNTGVTPIVYASSSTIKEQKLVELCREEGGAVWSANYWLGSRRIDGYDYSKCKRGIEDSLAWQYTETGRLKGHDGNLDLDVFYGTREDWLKWAGAGAAPKPSTPTAGAAASAGFAPGTYVLTGDGMRVRTGPGKGYRVKAYGELTDNAKQHAYSNGTLKKGTPVTVYEIKSSDGVWGRIPSGWVALRVDGRTYAARK